MKTQPVKRCKRWKVMRYIYSIFKYGMLQVRRMIFHCANGLVLSRMCTLVYAGSRKPPSLTPVLSTQLTPTSRPWFHRPASTRFGPWWRHRGSDEHRTCDVAWRQWGLSLSYILFCAHGWNASWTWYLRCLRSLVRSQPKLQLCHWLDDYATC